MQPIQVTHTPLKMMALHRCACGVCRLLAEERVGQDFTPDLARLSIEVNGIFGRPAVGWLLILQSILTELKVEVSASGNEGLQRETESVV